MLAHFYCWSSYCKFIDLPDLSAEPEGHHRADDQASLAIVLRERTVDPAV
jgi:hypothetical protein